FHAGDVARLEGGEQHRQIMANRQVGVEAEIGQPLTLLLAHMFGVDDIGLAHGLEPGLGSDVVLGHGLDRIPQLVVVLDGVFGLALGGAVFGVIGAFAQLDQLGIKETLLGLGVGVEEGGQTIPDRPKGVLILGIDLLDDREQAALLGV